MASIIQCDCCGKTIKQNGVYISKKEYKKVNVNYETNASEISLDYDICKDCFDTIAAFCGTFAREGESLLGGYSLNDEE